MDAASDDANADDQFDDRQTDIHIPTYTYIHTRMIDSTTDR